MTTTLSRVAAVAATAIAIGRSARVTVRRSRRVVDDVLTAGAHFVGIKRRLRERFPTMGNIIGCSYARRAVQTPSEDE